MKKNLEILDVTNFHFSFILGYFLPCYTQKNQDYKNEINHQEISSLYKCVPKIMITGCMVLKIWYARDVRTDRKSDIQRWVPHIKALLFFPTIVTFQETCKMCTFYMCKMCTWVQKSYHRVTWLSLLLGIFFPCLWIFPIRFYACSNLVSKSIQIATLYFLYIRF